LISDPDVLVEIGDIVGAQRKGDLLTLPVDQQSEIYFKLSKGTRSKARLYLKAAQQGTILEDIEQTEYFEVEDHSLGFEQEKPKKTAQKTKPASTCFSEVVPQEFHAALAHLEKHGSLTEKFLVNTLGGDGAAARKGRRFANKISEWLKDLPFDVYIEQTPEGKEYRRK